MWLLDERRIEKIAEMSPDVLMALVPLNVPEEYKKWKESKGKKYNPQFVYDEKLVRKTLRDTKRLIMPLARLAKDYMKFDDWRAELTTELLVSQVEDLQATEKILTSHLSRGKISARDYDDAIYRLFGRATNHELDLMEDFVYERDMEKFLTNLIEDGETNDFSRTKLNEVVKGFLHNFNGILTEEESWILGEKLVTADQVAEVIKSSIEYTANHSTLDRLHVEVALNDHSYTYGVAPKSIEMDAFFVDVPRYNLFADELLQTVAHEINSHLRVMLNSQRLQEEISPYFRPALVPRTQRALAQEGFATLNGETCLAQSFCGWFEPLIFLAPYYTKEEHNFAETVAFLYDLFNIDPDSDDPEMHFEIWKLMRFFFGTTDTSRRDNLVLPADQVYLLGTLRVLKELARASGEQFEEPLSLMRYSELPLEFLPKLDKIEKQRGMKLTVDPFPLWDYANLSPDVPTPTEYCKHLLLNL